MRVRLAVVASVWSAGAVALLIGVAMLSVPAAFIVGGVLALAAGAALDRALAPTPRPVQRRPQQREAPRA